MHPIVREVQKSQLKKVPEIKTGYTIRVHQKIREGNKERVQIFEGLVIKVGHGEGIEKTITVRKIVQGIGVEKVFPIHSANITKVEVKKKAKVRRSKLYYMRERSGKSARLQERHVTDQERAEEEAKMEAMVQEAVKADEKKKAEEAKLNPEKAEGEESEASADTAETSDDAVEAADLPPANEDTDEKPADETPKEEPKEEESSDKPADTAEPSGDAVEAEDLQPKEEEEESKEKPAE